MERRADNRCPVCQEKLRRCDAPVPAPACSSLAQRERLATPQQREARTSCVCVRVSREGARSTGPPFNRRGGRRGRDLPEQAGGTWQPGFDTPRWTRRLRGGRAPRELASKPGPAPAFQSIVGPGLRCSTGLRMTCQCCVFAEKIRLRLLVPRTL